MRHGIKRMGFVLAGLLLGAAAALAATPAEQLEQRTDIALRGADPQEVFQAVASLAGIETEVDPRIDGKVSIELHNVRVRTMLDAVCESIGCRWTLEGKPAKLRVSSLAGASGPEAGSGHATAPKDPIDLKVNNAEVQDLLSTFGQIMGAKAIIDPSLKGKVSLSLENTPCDQALDAVCSAAGCEWSFDAEKKVLRVFPRRKR